MTDANEILTRAHARAAARAAAHVPIDYAAMKTLIRRQRSALTRAVNSGDSAKVVAVCKAAVDEWDKPGAAWPDDWSCWQRALDDTLPWQERVDLRDLAG